ncbi:hypothetical protein ABZZ74_39090 [Streptomyces sp. NPDC006476]|uniref:hypothetical protein n=1 Tax=Streptomyces sp. NPDC006476 TaxID=3157175 RepID=UPI0033A14B5F
MRSGSRLLITLSLVSSILAGAGAATADTGIGGGSKTPPKPGQKTSGGSDNGTLSAGVIVYDRSKNGSGSSVGPVTSTTAWTPPACWYAPKYTPAQLKAYLEPIWNAESTGSQWDLEQRNKYEKGGDAPGTYKDFNKDKTGKGYWWDSYANESFPPGWDKCTEPIFWVDKGDPPPANVQNAVTPKILAELAYNEIRVPSTKVTLAPANTTKVNLPTWAWLDGAQFKPVSVTASVPVLGISATTTAEPISLKIDPGTADAQTYPASGVCQINGGRIGEPYAKGKANDTPPCGVKYLRSSGNGTYPLKATITWKIHWTGSDGTGDDLPDGTFGATQNVTVQEIQAVNR